MYVLFEYNSVLLYREMITGKPPWSQFNNSVTILFHIACQDSLPEYPTAASVELITFLNSCLQRDANRRPDTTSLLLHPFVSTVGGAAWNINAARPSTVSTTLTDHYDGHNSGLWSNRFHDTRHGSRQGRVLSSGSTSFMHLTDQSKKSPVARSTTINTTHMHTPDVAESRDFATLFPNAANLDNTLNHSFNSDEVFSVYIPTVNDLRHSTASPRLMSASYKELPLTARASSSSASTDRLARDTSNTSNSNSKTNPNTQQLSLDSTVGSGIRPFLLHEHSQHSTVSQGQSPVREPVDLHRDPELHHEVDLNQSKTSSSSPPLLLPMQALSISVAPSEHNDTSLSPSKTAATAFLHQSMSAKSIAKVTGSTPTKSNSSKQRNVSRIPVSVNKRNQDSPGAALTVNIDSYSPYSATSDASTTAPSRQYNELRSAPKRISLEKQTLKQSGAVQSPYLPLPSPSSTSNQGTKTISRTMSTDDVYVKDEFKKGHKSEDSSKRAAGKSSRREESLPSINMRPASIDTYDTDFGSSRGAVYGGKVSDKLHHLNTTLGERLFGGSRDDEDESESHDAFSPAFTVQRHDSVRFASKSLSRSSSDYLPTTTSGTSPHSKDYNIRGIVPLCPVRVHGQELSPHAMHRGRHNDHGVSLVHSASALSRQESLTRKEPVQLPHTVGASPSSDTLVQWHLPRTKKLGSEGVSIMDMSTDQWLSEANILKPKRKTKKKLATLTTPYINSSTRKQQSQNGARFTTLLDSSVSPSHASAQATSSSSSGGIFNRKGGGKPDRSATHRSSAAQSSSHPSAHNDTLPSPLNLDEQGEDNTGSYSPDYSPRSSPDQAVIDMPLLPFTVKQRGSEDSLESSSGDLLFPLINSSHASNTSSPARSASPDR